MSFNGKRWSQRVLIGGDEAAAAFVEPINSAPVGTEYAVPVRSVGSSTPGPLVGTPVTGSITATGQSVTVNVEGYGSCGITVGASGWTGNVLCQVSHDGGTKWTVMPLVARDSVSAGIYTFPNSVSNNYSPLTIQGATHVRAYGDTISAGSFDVTLTPIAAPSHVPPGMTSDGNLSFYNMAGYLFDTGAFTPIPVRNALTADFLSDNGVVIHHAGGWVDDATLAGITRIGGVFDDSGPTTVSEDAFGMVRITTYRAMHTNLRNNSGTEIGTSADPIRQAPGAPTTRIKRTYDWTGIVAATSIWTPAAGKKFVLTGYEISVSAACNVTLIDTTSGGTTDTLGNATTEGTRIVKYYFAANSGSVRDRSMGYISATADNQLKIIASAAGGSITVEGYEV